MAKDKSQSDENTDNKENQDEEFNSDTRFYKSSIPGLAVALPPLDEEDRSELHQEVKFTPYNFFDEKKGDHFQLGLLATDEFEVLEVLADDPNVEEISEEEYQQLLSEVRKG